MDGAIRRAEEEICRSGAEAGEAGLERHFCEGVLRFERWRDLTPKSAELSSGSFTGDTSIKLNAFH